MIVLNQLRDRWLNGQVAVIERGRRFTCALRDRAVVSAHDERGQTPTDYLMMVGLVVAVIVMVFMTFYWTTVKGAAQVWVGKVKEALGQ